MENKNDLSSQVDMTTNSTQKPVEGKSVRLYILIVSIAMLLIIAFLTTTAIIMNAPGKNEEPDQSTEITSKMRSSEITSQNTSSGSTVSSQNSTITFTHPLFPNFRFTYDSSIWTLIEAENPERAYDIILKFKDTSNKMVFTLVPWYPAGGFYVQCLNNDSLTYIDNWIRASCQDRGSDKFIATCNYFYNFYNTLPTYDMSGACGMDDQTPAADEAMQLKTLYLPEPDKSTTDGFFVVSLVGDETDFLNAADSLIVSVEY